MATAKVVATDLRAELKEWERAFAAANGGKKAGRQDIKGDPDIAAKYKTYGRLKALETAKSRKDRQPSVESTVEERPKKRKHASPTGPGHEQARLTTPRKSTKDVFATPSRPRTTEAPAPAPANHPSELDPYDSPTALRRLFSPSVHRQDQQPQTPLKAAVGPTPQRDGKALGLFDLLSESGGSTATPSAKRVASVQENAVKTPSRRKGMETITEENEEEQEEEDTPRGGRTPMSGKKLYLEDLFATPTTLKYAAMVEDENERRVPFPNLKAAAANSNEKGSAKKGVMAGSDTPSFLRRSNGGRSYNALDPAAGELSPIAARKTRPFVGRGLSALVQGLRDMEEERLEEDLDVLRELEADQEAMQEKESRAADVQPQVKLRGKLGKRPFKKKGQKRTTRRVHMKPVVVPKSQKKQPSPELEDDDDDDDEEQGEESEFVESDV